MLTTHNCIFKSMSKTMTVTLLCLRSCFLLLYTRFSTTAVYPLSPGKARSKWQATLSFHHFGSKIAVSSKIQSLDVTPSSSFTFSTHEIFRRRVDDVVIYFFFNSDFKFFDYASKFSVTSLYVVFVLSSKVMLIFPLYNKSSVVAEMGDRLVTIDMGRREGGC